MKNRNKFKRFWVTLSTALLIATTGVYAGETTRVSVSSAGVQGSDYSYSNAISADGRFVAFSSIANNLVAGDTNGLLDVFVRNLMTGKTTRISVGPEGEQGNDNSISSAISADTRYAMVYSGADNLVDGDTNGFQDVFVRDLVTGKTTRVSVSSAGVQGNGNSGNSLYGSGAAMSADGRYVAFGSIANNLVAGDTNVRKDRMNAFVHDRMTGKTTLVNVSSAGKQGNNSGWPTAISADGRYVAIDSLADNLVAGDTNGRLDVFVHDRMTGKTTRVSVGSEGEQGNAYSISSAISADGRYVAFDSGADNLVDGDTNNTYDAFVRDLVTGKTKRVSISSEGKQGNGGSTSRAISADGRYVAFSSYANWLPGTRTVRMMPLSVIL